MDKEVLNTLLSYFNSEITNKVELIENNLIVYFENKKRAKIKFENV